MEFGGQSKPSVTLIDSEGTKTRILNPTEQVTRKARGSIILESGQIKPQYAGRTKDIGDLVDLELALNQVYNLGQSKNIVKQVNAAVELYHENPNVPQFDVKVAKDPLVRFVHANQRAPTMEEVVILKDSKTPKSVIDKLAPEIKTEKKSILQPAKNPQVGPKTIPTQA